MKKIKRIKDLRVELKKLSQREVELGKLIHHDWADVREAAKLKNILKSTLNWRKQKAREGRQSWAGGLNYWLGLVAGILLQRAENRIETRIADKFKSIIKNFFRKRKKETKGTEQKKASN